jgi:hypothetical protein
MGHKMLLPSPAAHKMQSISPQFFTCYPMKSHAPSDHSDESGSEWQGRLKTPNKA